jgi:hypothetical protein
MARKYRIVNELGQCVIKLQGYSGDRRTKVIIAQQTSTHRIFLVTSEARQQVFMPVVTMPPHDLLATLVTFEWDYEFWTWEEAPHCVAGR